ncbi:Aspartic protease [Grifola frondosa]|uniref:Aspartic protease n=1 Tax=Grifola frondosa TaxID=5627 RepID=A0A1C7MUC5_GRIFR|nr:Aspartic protease [Grifola frondosa]
MPTMSTRSRSFLIFLLLATTSSAIHIPIRRQATHSTSVNFASHSSASSDFNATDPFYFGNINDVFYVGTIFVDGQPYEVQLDTGSSDLWLDTTGVTFSSNVTDTLITSSITYLDTTQASGDVLLAPVSWGEFIVYDQAFISAPGTNATSGGDKGLLGIGPPSLSSVADSLNGSSFNGASFLDNVFGLYPDEPNFYTFLLSRSDSGLTDGGIFTIGEFNSNFSNVAQTPKLPLLADDEWLSVMDGVIIDGVLIEGFNIPDDGQSVIPPAGQLSVLFDTGTSLANAPPHYVNATYGNIPGATYDSGTWYMPCDSKVNVSMVFGTNVYPVHPIDIILFDHIDEKGNAVCFGAFSDSTGSGQDFLLGDTFLRNVYAVYDFGRLVTVGDTDPFVQILSVTDADQAWAEYDSLNAARIAAAQSAGSGSNDQSSSAAAVVGGAIAETRYSASDVDVLQRSIFIIMYLLGAVILLLLVICVQLFWSSRQNKGYRALDNSSAGGRFGKYSE